MKFHCDRCKTRYSIADERVRGKILKIRCKNCSAVITVREGMSAGPGTDAASGPAAAPRVPQPAKAARSAPAVASVNKSASTPAVRAPAATAATTARGAQAASKGSALRGAFQDVMARPEPSASDSFHAAPTTLDEEWYVSIDGDQTGPMSLSEARGWVAEHRPEDELYCWNESMEDWLPVDKVSHFRGLRAATAPEPVRPPAPRAPSVPPPAPAAASRPMAAAAPVTPAVAPAAAEETPRPLFEATLERVTAEAAAEAESARQVPTNGARNGAGKSIFSELEGAAAELEFDIGEASRVVKLPMLMRVPEGGDARPFDSEVAGLPGVAKLGSGTGAQVALTPSAAAARGATGAFPRLGPLSNGAVADATPDILAPSKPRSHVLELTIGGVILIGLTATIAYYAVGSDAASTADNTPRVRADVYVEDLGTPFPGSRAGAAKPAANGSDDKVESTKVPDKRATTSARRTGIPVKRPSTVNGITGDDPSKPETVPGNDTADDAQNELTGMDVSRVARRYRMSTQRCYERALKKDPFLSVSKINIVLSVAPSGVVSDITMSSHKDSLLGTCLNQRIRAWAFPKSKKGIKTQVTVAFQKR